MLVDLNETKSLDTSHIVEWDSDFAKAQVKEFTLEMKNN
jgi:hypothetical protein